MLFLCVHNAGRSRTALGFLQELAGDGVVGGSGGSEFAVEVNPASQGDIDHQVCHLLIELEVQ